MSRELIQRAPGASMCCDAAGRLCSLAVRPVPLPTLISVAVARGEGTYEQVQQRIRDMLASGYLIEIVEG